MPAFTQRSMAGGEISPQVGARADVAKYQSGLRTCRNWFIEKFGGAANRAGTRFLAKTKSDGVARLISWRFNDAQTYVLEFGDQYLRVYREGAQLGAPYEISTPYLAADLFDLQVVQNADVMMIVHPSYAVHQLSRTGHTSWTLVAVTFSPDSAQPTGGAGTRGGAGANSYRYRITAIRSGTLLESLPGWEADRSGTLDYTVTPWTFTAGASHNYNTGDEIDLRPDGLWFLTGLEGVLRTITVTGGTTFTVDGTVGVAGTPNTAFARRPYIRIDSAAAPTSSAPNVLTWTDWVDALEYRIYRELNGLYIYIGTAGEASFDDIGYAGDATQTPPYDRELFDETGDYPRAVGFFQQRLLLAGSDTEPETVWGSRTGDFYNFTGRSPLQDDDALTWALSGRQVNTVRHLVDLGSLLILTDGGVWVARGDGDGVVTPTAANLRQQGYHGAATLSPILIGNSALYVQARGAIVRDLRYALEADGYQGDDLSVFATHLFEGHTIVDWAYQETPHSVVWCVRDDGILLGFTYLRDHQVWAWHRHDTATAAGTSAVESVACVPEGSEDALYLVVRREIDGATVRCVERMASRTIAVESVTANGQTRRVAKDAFFVDCGLSFDGRNDSAVTLTLSGGTDWVYTETLTLTASAATFTSADGATRDTFPTTCVGNQAVLRVGTSQVRVTITARTSSTVVSVQPTATVPVALRAVATSDWERAVHSVAGLDHLEGETVSICGDGDELPQQTVASGAVDVEPPCAVVHVGLPIVADLETLDLDLVDQAGLRSRRKRVSEVSVLVKDTRGLSFGEDADHLTESIDAVDSLTGTMEEAILTGWSDTGRVFIRQTSPLPANVLAIIPHVEIGG